MQRERATLCNKRRGVRQCGARALAGRVGCGGEGERDGLWAVAAGGRGAGRRGGALSAPEGEGCERLALGMC